MLKTSKPIVSLSSLTPFPFLKLSVPLLPHFSSVPTSVFLFTLNFFLALVWTPPSYMNRQSMAPSCFLPKVLSLLIFTHLSSSGPYSSSELHGTVLHFSQSFRSHTFISLSSRCIIWAKRPCLTQYSLNTCFWLTDWIPYVIPKQNQLAKSGCALPWLWPY